MQLVSLRKVLVEMMLQLFIPHCTNLLHVRDIQTETSFKTLCSNPQKHITS